MPVIPSQNSFTEDSGAVKLCRYAQIIRYSENAFFGINHPDNLDRASRKLWSKTDRDMISRYLRQAQSMIENYLQYHLQPTWIEGEQHSLSTRFFLNRGYVRALGTKEIDIIANTVPLDHTTDPAVMESVPMAESIVDTSEIHFYVSGTEKEVYPDFISLSANVLNAKFPRARLVHPDYEQNDDSGIDYDDTESTGPFAQYLDVKLVYTSSLNPGVFVWPIGTCGSDCEETETLAGCIRYSSKGVISVKSSHTMCGCPSREVRINYLSYKDLDIEGEEAIVHLAHSLMPVAPTANNDSLMNLWSYDIETPKESLSERANCAFGVSNGAWRAWSYVVTRRMVRSMML